MAVKVAFMQLSDCWGCHQSLLNTHLGLLPVLPALEFVYWPAVVDFKEDSLKARDAGSVLVGFIEGSIRTKQDLENVKLMREKCALIVAFGSCATYGNVTGLANQWDIDTLKRRKFTEVESATNETPTIPTQHVPEFQDKVINVDEVINVDVFMAGCPPRPEQIVSAIAFLLGQKPFPMNDLAFCNDCSIKNECLLDAGTLCFGPITSIGCSLKCTSDKKPCVGCFGPAKTVDSRADKLNSMVKNLTPLSSGDKKTIFEFSTLFLGLPLMAGFDLAGDILKQIKKRGAPETPLANLPPTTEDIGSTLLGFLGNNRDFTEISNVCDTCPRIIGSKSTMTKVKRDYEDLPNMEDCLIEQGYICMGPVTRAGCGGLCIKVNAPCTGCYGQTVWGVNQAERFADTVVKGFNVSLSKEEILSQVKDHIGTFEKFTLASRKGGI
ncbi:MAG: NADH-quinone oxidoreductase subunit B family protein [Promethearchaeota archaeon]|jgi:F420-non-reducing hydrogenase small subunit